MIDESAIRLRFKALDAVLDEPGRRRFAAAEALTAGRGGINERGRRRFAAAEATAGRGGISMVSRATGLARSTIGRGLVELRDGGTLDADRVRRSGGGRKPLSETDASLLDDLVIWSIPRRGAIRNRRSCGPRRASASWPKVCVTLAT